MSTDKTIILTLTPLPCGVPISLRIRQALKTLLRRDRFRCTKVEGDGLAEPQTADGPAAASAPPVFFSRPSHRNSP
jgi:hypothetical protein